MTEATTCLHGTETKKCPKCKMNEILDTIIRHGFGEMNIVIHEAKNYKTKIVVKSGCSWVFFLEKDLPDFKKENIL